MAKAFIQESTLTDIADSIRATLDESRQYLPSEMAAAIDSIPIMAQLNRKKYFQPVPAGAASGYATIEQIEGNTVVWNQLFNNILNIAKWSPSGDTFTFTHTDTTYAGVCTATGNSFAYYFALTNLIPDYHKILVSVDVLTSETGSNYSIRPGRNGNNPTFSLTANQLTKIHQIYTVLNGSSDTQTYLIFQRNSSFAVGSTYDIANINIIDLTAIFGAGNEPTTVAEFEAWLAQNIGALPYYDYNAGELLSVKMSGMQTEDSSQQTLDTMTLDITTITGINTATNVREVIFPNGMKQADRAGTVKDILDLLSDTATVNVGSRAYQSGDESDTTVITDGTTTYYALTTPIEYTNLQDGNGNPLNPRYKVEQGGTEQVLPVNTSTPTTVAPALTTTYTKDVH